MVYVHLLFVSCMLISDAKTEFDKKIADLDRTGESKIELCECNIHIKAGISLLSMTGV